MTATNPAKARVKYQHDDPPNPGPNLDVVADRDRLALFDPKRCDDQEHWIQIDAQHAVNPEEVA